MYFWVYMHASINSFVIVADIQKKFLWPVESVEGCIWKELVSEHNS